MFNAGRAVGKGVKYLTKLGSKIGSGLKKADQKLGQGVSSIGQVTRNTQAATIKGARGVRDAVSNAGAAARRGASDARRGYNVGRQDLVNGDIMPKKSNSVRKLPSLKEFMNTKGKGYMQNPGTMPGNRMTKNLPGNRMTNKSVFSGAMGKTTRDGTPIYRPKARRAGEIVLGASAAGYGLHKANDAIQNHYRQQKNAARGG